MRVLPLGGHYRCCQVARWRMLHARWSCAHRRVANCAVHVAKLEVAARLFEGGQRRCSGGHYRCCQVARWRMLRARWSCVHHRVANCAVCVAKLETAAHLFEGGQLMNSLGATVSMLPSNSMTNTPRSAFPQRSSKRSEGSAEQEQ